MAVLTPKYKYNKERNRVNIILYDEGNPIATLSVQDAAKLVGELTGCINDAFYDFTAACPNMASSHHWLKR